MQIYLTRDGQQLGPYDEAAIRAGLQNGAFTPADLAWFEGAAGWAPLATVPGLGAADMPPPSPPVAAAPAWTAPGVPASPSPFAPAATPAGDGAAKRWTGRITSCASIVVALVSLLVYVSHCSTMGKRYKASNKESVNYSGQATEQDARKLGDALKQIGYFDGSKATDVLLHKDTGKTTVSFVVGTGWNDDKTKRAFRDIGKSLADKATGHPLTVRLVDTKLNTKAEMQID